MEFHARTGATTLRSAPLSDLDRSTRKAAGDAGDDAVEAALLEPGNAAMAIISRCANHTLTQQLENAYAAATQARDYARTAAAVAARDCPTGPARDALVATWARQESDAERMMRAVLRFGREHGHLAFAFSVYG
jgi:hypothetical protein